MTSTGLLSAERLYGSAWQFQRLRGDRRLSRIQFHEPSPRGKIPFTTARHYGRRFNKNFGWVGDLKNPAEVPWLRDQYLISLSHKAKEFRGVNFAITREYGVIVQLRYRRDLQRSIQRALHFRTSLW
ncbi:hypothetical protein F5Y03DRAFT_298569 [Xylaria venustula]|nr:hypothetical protein F5Y03DRAFT_298569 [Xylaria venustula]